MPDRIKGTRPCILRGLQFKCRIDAECESLEEAIKQAREWEFINEQDRQTFSFAVAVDVVDVAGNVILDEEALRAALDA